MDTLEEARTKNGDTGCPPLPLPAWLNMTLIKEGQSFIQRNFFSIFFAHFISLIFLLCYTPVRLVLMKTGQSDSDVKSLKRYLSTLLHVKEWYEGDLMNLEGQTYNDIQRVRRIHSGVSRSVKIFPVTEVESKSYQISKCCDKDHDELVLAIQGTRCNRSDSQKVNISEPLGTKPFSISQLDMIVTQFCFMGFVSLFPQKVGIHADESEGLRGFVHLWAVIGHLLGIEEQFNICLEENKNLRKVILYQILLPEFQNCHPGTLVLWKSLVSGLSTYVPLVKLKSALLFILKNILDFIWNLSDLEGMLNMHERFCYKIMSLCFSTWLKYLGIRMILNFLLRCTISSTAKSLGTNINNSSSSFVEKLNPKVDSVIVT